MNVHRGPGSLARLLDALAEPTRRRAYQAVQRARGPLSRAEVAQVLDISTRLAAFHLDRLVQEGLLVAHYARPAGRRGGPGAGRPTKWYTPTADGLEVTVPPRRNDVAARILLRAHTSQAQETGDAVVAAARSIGVELASPHQSASGFEEFLTDFGYEPTAGADGGLDLVNCPFHELVHEDRQTVCSMNHAMLEAAATQTHAVQVVTFEPRDGLCCVRIRPPAQRTRSGG